MGSKAAIIDASNGGRVLGHIDDDAVSFSSGRGTIVGEAAHHLKECLGQGYGRRKFHLLRPGSRLEGCRVVSPHVVFTYEQMHLLDDDEAPPTYPDHVVEQLIIDDETSSDDTLFTPT